MKVRNTPKVSIQYLNIERDKWVRFVLCSKPNLPRYSSLSGGSRLPQHWCLPWLWCGGHREAAAWPSSSSPVRLLGKPPQEGEPAFCACLLSQLWEYREFCSPVHWRAALYRQALSLKYGNCPTSSGALDSVGRAQHCSLGRKGCRAPGWWFPANRSSGWGWKVQ